MYLDMDTHTILYIYIIYKVSFGLGSLKIENATYTNMKLDKRRMEKTIQSFSCDFTDIFNILH